MSKRKLAKSIAIEAEISERKANKIIDAYHNFIREELQNGNIIELRGFATFFTKLRGEKVGQNINTGESIAIPEKVVPRALFHFDVD